jgi:hypothetical protein
MFVNKILIIFYILPIAIQFQYVIMVLSNKPKGGRKYESIRKLYQVII